jgi:endonuclease/exonuclease/phosphatase family metal-dependent hydrolase
MTTAARVRPRPRVVVAGVLAVGAAAVAFPDRLFGLDRVSSTVAALAAVRPYAVGAVAAAAFLVAAGAVLWGAARPSAVGLAVVATLGAASLLPRVVPDAVPAGGTARTVLSFNVHEGGADPAALAGLVRAARPDLVALPEAGERYRARLAPLLEPQGYRLVSSTGPATPDVDAVVLAIGPALDPAATAVRAEAAPMPFVEVTGGGLGTLRFAAVHVAAPTPAKLPRWRADLAGLDRWCAGPTAAVVAGDLNATLDHSPLRAATAGCGDAGAQRGHGLTPTWPTWPGIPAWLGVQIDHVLATSGIVAETFEVRSLPGSDHRAVLTRLRVPD